MMTRINESQQKYGSSNQLGVYVYSSAEYTKFVHLQAKYKDRQGVPTVE